MTAIREDDKVVQLTPAHGGKPPYLGDGAGLVHAEVRRRMCVLLESDQTPSDLDAQSRTTLEQARREYAARELDRSPVITDGADTLLFPWTGDRQLHTLAAIFTSSRMDAAPENSALRLTGTTPAAAITALTKVAQGALPDPLELARKIENKATEKFDSWLG